MGLAFTLFKCAALAKRMREERAKVLNVRFMHRQISTLANMYQVVAATNIEVGFETAARMSQADIRVNLHMRMTISSEFNQSGKRPR